MQPLLKLGQVPDHLFQLTRINTFHLMRLVKSSNCLFRLDHELGKFTFIQSFRVQCSDSVCQFHYFLLILLNSNLFHIIFTLFSFGKGFLLKNRSSEIRMFAFCSKNYCPKTEQSGFTEKSLVRKLNDFTFALASLSENKNCLLEGKNIL